MATTYQIVELDVQDIELIETMLADGSARDHHEAISMIAAGPLVDSPWQRVIIGPATWLSWKGQGRQFPAWRAPGMYD